VLVISGKIDISFKRTRRKAMKVLTPLLLIVLATILFVGCSQEEKEFTYKKTEKNIDHIHGLGFSDSNFYIATHTGLKKYDGQDWYATTNNNHDYMGFSMTKDGFYSSGHPGEGTELKNPLGLIKSLDEGKTLERLAFYGESDFHYLTAGYDSDAIYVINQQPNSEIEEGLYYTLDEGKTWKKGNLSEIMSDSIGNLAAHPIKEEVISVATKDGLYLSTDYGDSFELITDSFMVPSAFLLEDTMIYSAIKDDGIHLYSQNINENNAVEISIPNIAAVNPILFVTANQKNPDQMAIITYSNDIYITEDNGGNWKQIVSEGKIK